MLQASSSQPFILFEVYKLSTSTSLPLISTLFKLLTQGGTPGNTQAIPTTKQGILHTSLFYSVCLPRSTLTISSQAPAANLPQQPFLPPCSHLMKRHGLTLHPRSWNLLLYPNPEPNQLTTTNPAATPPMETDRLKAYQHLSYSSRDWIAPVSSIYWSVEEKKVLQTPLSLWQHQEQVTNTFSFNLSSPTHASLQHQQIFPVNIPGFQAREIGNIKPSHFPKILRGNINQGIKHSHTNQNQKISIWNSNYPKLRCLDYSVKTQSITGRAACRH